MKIFESPIYALNGTGCLPFKVVIEETRVNDRRKVEVKKIEYATIDGKMIENEGLMFATGWTERQTPIMSMGSDDCRGSSLMFDFGAQFLDIMKNGGKTVLSVYSEQKDDFADETWTLKADKYVCESKELSYTLEEFVDYMDDDNCDNIDVYQNDELKICVSNINF